MFHSCFPGLNKQGVFSAPANMSRLKTQLALEANRRYTVIFRVAGGGERGGGSTYVKRVDGVKGQAESVLAG